MNATDATSFTNGDAAGNTRLRPLFAIAVCALVAGVVWFIYGQTTAFDFVFFDDNVYLMENERVREGLTAENIRWAFLTAHHSNWHPVTWLSYLADVTSFGFDPGVFHRTNAVLHALNSVLLFFVLTYMTKRAGLSALVGLLFAAHPLHVESVAWISERKDVLSFFFGLLTVWAYAAWAVRDRWWQYTLTLLFFTLGLMAKPMLVTLPLLLLLLDFWPLNRWPHERLLPPPRLWVDKIPLLILSAVAGMMTLAAQYAGGGVQTLATIPLGQRLANVPVAYVMYLYRTIVPTDLAVFYPHPGANLSVFGWIAALAVLILFSIWIVRRRIRFPALFAGWWWFIIALLPVIGIVQVGGQAWADRYAYLPHAGLLFALVWFIAGMRRERSLVGVVVALAMVIGCAFLARAQTGHWRDSGTLFAHAVAVTENNVLAHDVLGRYYLSENQPEEAAEQFAAAAQINPEYAEAWLQLGAAYMRMERPLKASEAFAAGVAANPHHIDLRYQLGRAYTAIDDHKQAETQFAAAVAEAQSPDKGISPEQLAVLLTAQGSALARQERFFDARAVYQRAIEANPRYTLAQYNLATAYMKLDNAMQAEAHLRVVLDQDPNFPGAVELLRTVEAVKAVREKPIPSLENL